MAVDYKQFLAAEILGDKNAVNYRSLSRALKVHVNLAKQMLYEFHHNENSRKPGSVHATYLITGIRKPVSLQSASASDKDDDDTPMQSSPFIGTPMTDMENQDEIIPVKSITLVKEERLDYVKELYETITAIHIYSLEPSSMKDIRILGVINQDARTKYRNEDPMLAWKQYGVIQNKNVKRRKMRVPLPVSAPPGPHAITVKKSSQPEPLKQETSTQSSESKQKSASEATHKVAERTQPRRSGSDIFKAFAKTKPKRKKEDTESSAAASPAISTADSDKGKTDGDSPMPDLSDDGDNEEDVYLDKPKKDTPPVPSARTEREKKLRAMMDDDDEDMPDASSSTKPTPPAEEPPEEEERGEEEQEEAHNPPASTSRRRGKRKVMKKKVIKDEEGYLVTQEEAVWESFSEDEAPPPSKKTHTHPPSSSSKGGKSGSKAHASQGNIMSFFKKK